MSLPIIIAHKGFVEYPYWCAESCLRQGVNPILLGTQRLHNGAEFVNIGELGNAGEPFRKAYKHASPHPYEWELFCYQRWFYIAELARRRGFDQMLCIDSDVLVFARPEEFVFSQGSLHACHDRDAGCWTIGQSIFTLKALEEFCEYMLTHQNGNDMATFTDWLCDVHTPCVNAARPFEGKAYDHHICHTTDWKSVPFGKIHMKEITFDKGQPYGMHKVIGRTRLLNLHFWGPTKHLMQQYIDHAHA